MKSYNEKEIKDIFKEQAYKFASLRDNDNKVVVPYNTAKSKETATDKLNEAFKRLKNLPDGLYTFCFQNSQGRNVVADTYGYIKGSIPTEATENRGTTVHVIQPQQANASDKVLSYTEVLDLKMNLARVEAERDRYKAESEQYKKEVEELEAELNEVEAKTEGLSESTGTTKWMEMLSSSLLPIADRYLAIKEKQVEQKAQPKKVRRVVRKQQKVVLPEIGSQNWDMWLAQLESYTDEQFNNVLEFLKKTSMPHYNAVIEEFESDENLNEELEETEDSND
jgi:hypothetical protein